MPVFQERFEYSQQEFSKCHLLGHDDLHAYRAIQQGLATRSNPWVSLHRDYHGDEVGAADRTVNGASEISMRNQFRAWAKYMG